jgi:hypothetical protein
MADIAGALKSPLTDGKWAVKTAVGGAFPLVPMMSFIIMIMTGALAAGTSGQAFLSAFFGALAAVSTGIFVLSPLLNFFSFGFIVARARKVYSGEGALLPEWKDWKKLYWGIHLTDVAPRCSI